MIFVFAETLIQFVLRNTYTFVSTWYSIVLFVEIKNRIVVRFLIQTITKSTNCQKLTTTSCSDKSFLVIHCFLIHDNAKTNKVHKLIYIVLRIYIKTN